MNRKTFFLSAVLLTMTAFGLHGQSGKAKAPIVRQVDRVLIESGDPKALFHFFSEELQLPEAWPLTESQGYVSGGVGTGDANIEFYRYAETGRGSARGAKEARYAGLALEPRPLAEALRGLKAAGIPYGAPEPYVSTLPDGAKGVQWTMVPLPSFSRPGMSVFLYEYSPAYLNVNIRRKQLGNRLTLNHGGPLGILSVREITIASTNFERDQAAWKLLMGEPPSAENRTAGSGPAIRLIRGKEDRIQEIAFSVKSLETARAFLKKNNLLGSASAKEIFLNPSKIQTLRVRLVG